MRSVVLACGQNGACARVYFDVLVANVDVEDELAVVVLEVDFADGAAGRRLRGGDGRSSGEVTLIAVSKGFSAETIAEAIAAGQRESSPFQ